jgi:hypothetical protein
VQSQGDVVAGLKSGLLIGLAFAALVLPARGGFSLEPARQRAALRLHRVPQQADFATEVPSPDARTLADWVASSADNQGLQFAILDKRGARLYVFNASAHLLGSSLVLLGSAPGDDSAPGIGQRPLAQIRADERTTAAGRFISRPGHDETGEGVIWVDYASALAMHRIKTVLASEHRFERMATASIADKRISNGCINVPISFFDSVVEPALGRSAAVVYVLPEVKPMQEVFRMVDALSTR